MACGIGNVYLNAVWINPLRSVCVLSCRWRLVGEILVGASSDEPNDGFSTAARDTMLTVTGVDLRSITYRYKFTFVAQVGSPQITERTHGTGSSYTQIRTHSKTRGRLKVGSPQKAVYEVRDASVPCGLSMDVLVRGQSMKTISNSSLATKPIYKPVPWSGNETTQQPVWVSYGRRF